MKAISLLTRRADLSRDAFRRYYEEIHSPLAIAHFPYRQYTRNHLVDEVGGLDFDCISEFQMQRGFDIRQAMQSRSRALMRDDERKFMRPERIRVAMSEESVMVEGAKTDDALSQLRYALLFSRAGRSQTEFRREVEAWARSLSRDIRGLRRMSLDLLSPVVGSDFPFDALLWLQLDQHPERPPGLTGPAPGLLAAVQVHTHSSSAQQLKQGFVAFLP
ncbi:EthD domain-containing protein [Halopseudomonas aestusnigri]|jgi:hypothetical protein|uniref:EthD domain-containing protein n=1 Tax=Halopseudomonas TaxID=2901189 RepID=UPI0022B674C4|nr:MULTISPECIES: EthD domain-containing protein [Halopseudomonas]MDL2198107.1 EthD domain-containing protein [Halopseudomonas aestusnigri]BDX20184.1 hypothetical protein MFKK_29940 [Halopseudomonas aestusnigri]